MNTTGSDLPQPNQIQPDDMQRDEVQLDSTTSNLFGYDRNTGGPLKLKKVPITTIENAIAKTLNELIGENASTLVCINDLSFQDSGYGGQLSIALTITKHTTHNEDELF